MEAAVIPEILKLGILGVLNVVQGYAIVRLYNRVEALQDKRVEDTSKLVTLMESMRDTAERQATALTALADLIKGDLMDFVKADLMDFLRKGRGR